MGAGSYDDLRAHVGHRVVVVAYGDSVDNGVNAAVECEDCGVVLVDFNREDDEPEDGSDEWAEQQTAAAVKRDDEHERTSDKRTPGYGLGWMDVLSERGTDGKMTPMAIAVLALQEDGCECIPNVTCTACLCEAALKEERRQRRKLEKEHVKALKEARVRLELCATALSLAALKLRADNDGLRERIKELYRKARGCEFCTPDCADECKGDKS